MIKENEMNKECINDNCDEKFKELHIDNQKGYYIEVVNGKEFKKKLTNKEIYELLNKTSRHLSLDTRLKRDFKLKKKNTKTWKKNKKKKKQKKYTKRS